MWRPGVFRDAELGPLDQLVDVVAHLGAHDLARGGDLQVLRKLQVPACKGDWIRSMDHEMSIRGRGVNG